jgi:hypothetical protein
MEIVLDAVMAAVLAAFFLACIGLVVACDRLTERNP